MKYWHFFVDSLRLLRTRHSPRSPRIDITHLTFIQRYHSRSNEFRSIALRADRSFMPDSTTADAIYFSMSIKAVEQLRTYWVPRYRAQASPPTVHPSFVQTTSDVIVRPSPSSIEHVPRTSSTQLARFTLDTMSYLRYNPQQFIRIQSSLTHPYQGHFEDDFQSIDRHSSPTKSISPLPPSSDRSIADYATENNLGLFYRLLASDSLAGGPFLSYISEVVSKQEARPLEVSLRFIADAEVLLSLTRDELHERLCRRFITR